jgi:hypothetical protein
MIKSFVFSELWGLKNYYIQTVYLYGTIRVHEIERKYGIYVESIRNKTVTYYVQQNSGEATAFTVVFFVTFVVINVRMQWQNNRIKLYTIYFNEI